MRQMWIGVLLAAAGFLSIVVGLFSGIGGCYVPGAPCQSPRLDELLAYGGLVVLLVGIVTLGFAGWRGSVSSWVIAALAIVPATWTLYEIARQGPCVTAASGLLLAVCS